MAIEIKVPDMGESIIEATLAAWIKHEGDAVAAGEPVVDLETDKVTLQVSAPEAGILGHIAHQVGETVAVGEVLATLAAPGGSEAVEAGKVAAAQEAAPPPAQSAPAQVEAAKASSTVGENGGAHPTPVAERMARQMGVDLSQIPPTGSGGRITKEDVQAFVDKLSQGEERAPVLAAPAISAAKGPVVTTPRPEPGLSQASSSTARPEERVRMSRRRQTIARRLVEVRQVAAMLTTFNEIDMSVVMDLRKRRREAFKERYGVDLGYMSFFVKATLAALKAFPSVNAEIQGEEIVFKRYYDIGIAIGAKEGLVVPVLRDADRLNFAGIEAAIRQYVDKVKNSTLSLEDLRGGTFTITNGGVYGSLMSTPILNPPQVGILGMHAIQERPIAVGGQVVIRPMMYVALSYDHRLVDGREAVQFLVRIKQLLENPEDLLLG